jgi:hypothetical protein
LSAVRVVKLNFRRRPWTRARSSTPGDSDPLLITQRSEVQILPPPLPRRTLSESLSVLRRKGPDHSWQQFGSKHRRPETRPRRGTQTHHSWLVGSLGWKPSGLDAAPQAERDLRQAASSAPARVGYATRSHCAGLDFASARSRLTRSFLHRTENDASRAAIGRLDMTEIRRIPGAWVNQRHGR